MEGGESGRIRHSVEGAKPTSLCTKIILIGARNNHRTTKGWSKSEVSTFLMSVVSSFQKLWVPSLENSGWSLQ
jgi:hypothetical protein